jgi:hypothetical protein
MTTQQGGNELALLGLNCIGNETLAVANSAVELTPPEGTKSAIVQCQANALTTSVAKIRFWDNGSTSAPTATVGQFLQDGEAYLVRAGCLSTFRAISADAANAQQLNIQYYG